MCYHKGGGKSARGKCWAPNSALSCIYNTCSHMATTTVKSQSHPWLSMCPYTHWSVFHLWSLSMLPSQLNQVVIFFSFSIQDSYTMNASMVFSSSHAVMAQLMGVGGAFSLWKIVEKNNFGEKICFHPRFQSTVPWFHVSGSVARWIILMEKAP